jgi:hypothetical protein
VRNKERETVRQREIELEREREGRVTDTTMDVITTECRTVKKNKKKSII